VRACCKFWARVWSLKSYYIETSRVICVVVGVTRMQQINSEGYWMGGAIQLECLLLWARELLDVDLTGISAETSQKRWAALPVESELYIYTS
jgi:hypothetical protein